MFALPADGNGSAGTCAGSRGPGRACFAQLANHGYRQLVTYQPASRFWAFQWYETAIFLALAAGLAGSASGGSGTGRSEDSVQRARQLSQVNCSGEQSSVPELAPGPAAQEPP